MYYYLQDSNAYLCLAIILFISTITKWFGYDFDILVVFHLH